MIEVADTMDADDWAALPPLGTRVRVPYPRFDAVGEIVLHHRLFGEPVARVRVALPVSREPLETHNVNMTYVPGDMEIISD